MSLVVEYAVDTAELALGDPLERHPSLRLDVEHTYGDGERTVLFLWLSGPDIGGLESTLAADPAVAALERFDEVDGRGFYRLVLAGGAGVVLYPHWVDLGGARLAAHATAGRWHDRLLFPGHEALATYRERLAAEGVEFDLERLYEPDRCPRFGNLTDRQRETLRLALERGFFEIPREATAGDLAAELGISEQAVSERLRRGYARLVRETLG